MIGASYCSQCGSRIAGGNRFCPSCGSPVESDDGNEVATEKQPGLLSKVGNGLAAIVAIPLMIVMSLIGLVLPLLFIAALAWGPSETWDRVQAWIPRGGGEVEAAGCEGFDEWVQGTDDRGQELVRLLEPVTKREVEDPAALQATSNEVRELLRDQEQSNPPPEAEILNDQLVEVYKLSAMLLIALADGDASRMAELDDEYDKLSPLVDEEDKRVRQACL